MERISSSGSPASFAPQFLPQGRLPAKRAAVGVMDYSGEEFAPPVPKPFKLFKPFKPFEIFELRAKRKAGDESVVACIP